MTITFYNYAGRPEEFNKTLSNGTQLVGNQVASGQDLCHPNFVITSATAPSWNYLYTADLSRYYFIDKWTWQGSTVWQCQTTIDIRMSCKTQTRDAYATVDFSTLGDQRINDPRISFDGVPNVTVSTATVPAQGLQTWVVLRYYYAVDGFYSSQITPESEYDLHFMWCAIMSPKTFKAFMYHYNQMNEQNRVAVGTNIIDMSIVHYIGRLPNSEYMVTSNLPFRTPQLGRITVALNDEDGNNYAWLVRDPQYLPLIPSYTIDTPAVQLTADFWNMQSAWEFLLPYAGSIQFTPRDCGVQQITSVQLDVSYEPYENAYIITPVVNYETRLTQLMQVIPVRTTTAFPIDTSFDNLAMSHLGTVLSVSGTLAGNVASSLAMSNPVGAVANTMTAPQNIIAGINQWQADEVRAASGFSYAGSDGGVPAYTTQIDGTKIYWIKKTAVPRPGASEFRDDYGYADGAFRKLSALAGQGYFVASRVDLRNTSGMTSEEQTLLRSALAAGSWWS